MQRHPAPDSWVTKPDFPTPESGFGPIRISFINSDIESFSDYTALLFTEP